MDAYKDVLLERLTRECEALCAIPENQHEQKREKKQFINGLMTASRLVGISYEELSAVIEAMPSSKFKNLEEKLNIPAYIRNNIDIGRLKLRD
ncbi:hypothetical protein LRP49_02380 [Enterovibrio sp. ZSDZ35]|uniref:Uncharacterized protein n=1 Tax=Enterovibrio qingdaonensis TaxID=2899818 RepID=A0ABT5QGD6_9GAMM|nr:hypothetical protein [Enterovibrio sp. ZSDZ35]MDD1780035.1 hypothetical protein [Enterovibrio sp. ZSDZ35]